ncbi:hypothetical protein P6U16_06335 [Rhizobium sp. 32-5/1]|uniref:hypothetical protein n=1 Tax=Rhizobium sp. 32-5/1 TaxID=3019602 RepID=UPI00240CF34D|nr:hypothetical protein [Rhizobium sp. 32-5/1]WEZ84273.1 hypothetical protein P6U16_06335 [Rhizobium sp. 32-5/1]
MRFVSLAAAFSLLSCGPALATGGFSCQIDDPVLALGVESGFSHGLGDALLNFRGTINIRDAFASKNLQKIALDATHLPHHWLYDDVLKLRIYAETGEGPFASVDLVIETKRDEDDETAYGGTYRLSLYHAEPPAGSPDQQLVRTGTVTCSAG